MSTDDGYVCLFRNNFFSDIIFVKVKVLQHKEEDYIRKKDRSPYSFRRKQSLNFLAKLFGSDPSDAQYNTKESL